MCQILRRSRPGFAAHRKPLDDLVLMTSEGLRPLVKLARARGLDQAFIAALPNRETSPAARNPARRCARTDSERSRPTEKPTTEGVIEMLGKLT